MIQSYPWYIGDWRSCETRLNLTLEERGLYRELLDFYYVERSLPTDERTLARIANCSDEEFIRSWPKVKPLFTNLNDRYRNKKADQVLEKLDRYQKQRSEAGKHSGERRRNARSFFVGPSVAKTGNERPNEKPTISTQHITARPAAEKLKLFGGDGASQDKEGNILISFPFSMQQSEWFTEWWKIYWRHKGKQPAEKSFCKFVRTQEMFERVMVATRDQMASMMERQEEFRPHGATWLNQRRWEDEPEISRKTPEPVRLLI